MAVTWWAAALTSACAWAGAQASAQDIIDFCKDRLADFKKPRSVDFVTELPKNSNGKLSRKDVRERYWQGRDRKVN